MMLDGKEVYIYIYVLTFRRMMPAAAPSSVASSLPGSVSGSHPGTPFSPSTFNEPNWPTNTSSATAAADQDEGDRMSLNQKNMLKVSFTCLFEL